jgi:rubrerythrin
MVKMAKKKKIPKKKLDYFIKDEEKATKEYFNLYKKHPHLKMFREMSKDERKHANYLKKLKKQMYGGK